MNSNGYYELGGKLVKLTTDDLWKLASEFDATGENELYSLVLGAIRARRRFD